VAKLWRNVWGLTRLRILAASAASWTARCNCRLSEGECPVSELVELTGLSQSAVSQHLARLREGGMVLTRREATTIYYRVADQAVHDLIGMLCERFGGRGQQAATA
jgi:DNA-binding transcriptional ArsR family regulator